MKTFIRFFMLFVCLGFFAGQTLASTETFPEVVVFGKILEPERWADFESQVSNQVVNDTFPAKFLGDETFRFVEQKNGTEGYLLLVRPSLRKIDPYSSLFVHQNGLKERITFTELREHSQASKLTIPVDREYLRSLTGVELAEVKKFFPKLIANHTKPIASGSDVAVQNKNASTDEAVDSIGNLLAQIEPLRKKVANLERSGRGDADTSKQLRDLEDRLTVMIADRFEELKSSQDNLIVRQDGLSDSFMTLKNSVLIELESITGLKTANQDTRNIVYGVVVIVLVLMVLLLAHFVSTRRKFKTVNQYIVDINKVTVAKTEDTKATATKALELANEAKTNFAGLSEEMDEMRSDTRRDVVFDESLVSKENLNKLPLNDSPLFVTIEVLSTNKKYFVSFTRTGEDSILVEGIGRRSGDTEPQSFVISETGFPGVIRRAGKKNRLYNGIVSEVKKTA